MSSMSLLKLNYLPIGTFLQVKNQPLHTDRGLFTNQDVLDTSDDSNTLPYVKNFLFYYSILVSR